MNNETYLDFCFIREELGGFASDIDELLKQIFTGACLNWYLEEKITDGTEIVIAEVKGMSRWRSEDEVQQFLEDNAGERFWNYLQGYKMYIYPATMRGCSSCATH